jgi:hypothetical protein
MFEHLSFQDKNRLQLSESVQMLKTLTLSPLWLKWVSLLPFKLSRLDYEAQVISKQEALEFIRTSELEAKKKKEKKEESRIDIVPFEDDLPSN